MPFVPGERIDAGNRAAYIIDGVIDATPFGTRYSARKIFYNFRFSDNEFYEAAQDEWVAVQVRAAAQGTRSDSDDARLIRELLEYGAGAILGNFPAWFPEPLDWLEHAGERLLITSQLHGETLREWRAGPAFSPARGVRAAGEILKMLDAIHAGAHAVGAVGPDDFTIDPTGRIGFLATDRVLPVSRVAGYRRVYPPERFPSAFAPPEIRNPRGSFDARSDLFSWSTLLLGLLTGFAPADEALDASGGNNGQGELLRSEVESALAAVVRVMPDALSAFAQTGTGSSKQPDVRGWSIALAACLSDDPDARPASVARFRQLATARGPMAFFDRLRVSRRLKRA